jgi:hypothetical protein
MRKMIAIASMALFGVPAMASAALVGQCADCHTMHNSEQGKPVAIEGLAGTVTATPLKNLLRMDCIACHAMDSQGPAIQVLDGGSVVPQVYHGGLDLFKDTLAAGNFRFADDGFRKGHNVIDLFPGGDATGGDYTKPPGFVHGGDRLPLDRFTCAGVNGCHGTRNQLLPSEDGSRVERVGMAAISGAHHLNYRGEKIPEQPNGNGAGILSISGWKHDGASLADSYRFIRGLRGMCGVNGDTRGILEGVDMSRWDAASVRYYGTHGNGTNGDSIGPMWDGGTAEPGTCSQCHIGEEEPNEYSSIIVPNQSMTGFCITCHGEFHSTGTENGTSGAFLRHPSDYLLPSWGEYAHYEENVTAPVAYNDKGDPIVMCLSCHAAHASPYDALLRFDYAATTSNMRAGDRPDEKNGCLACHTTKGINPKDRK